LQPSSMTQDLEFLAQEMLRRMIVSPWDPSNYFCDIPTASNKKLQQANQRVASFIGNLIDERQSERFKKNEDEKDVPQDLLSSLIYSSQDQDKVAKDDIVNVIKSLLFAGFETTSTALTFVLCLIAQHPQVEEKCLQEILSRESPSLSDEGGPADYPYLNAVITESLRLYPPVISTTRSLDRDFELQQNDWACQAAGEERVASGGTIHVPAGTYLYFPIWVIQRSPKNFSNPTSFQPERWLDKNTGPGDGSVNERGNKDAFIAFSAGGRSCAGEKFARQEMIVALRTLLRPYKFELMIDPATEISVHREGLVISTKEPVAMKILRR
jgi:cytochrome P450